jgi:hypothetical protein
MNRIIPLFEFGEDEPQIKPGIITFIDNRENLQRLEISSLLMLKLKESLSMKM